MAGIFDFLSGTAAPEIPDAVKDRRLLDWQRYGTGAGADALEARNARLALEASRAGGAGTEYAKVLADKSKDVLAREAWGRSGAAATGAEALGTIGRGLKAATGIPVQAALYSGDAEAPDLTQEQRAKYGEDVSFSDDAKGYTMRVQDNAKRAAGVAPRENNPISLMNTPQDSDLDDPAEVQAAQSALNATAQPPVENTPAGPAVEKNPVTVPQAAAKTAQDTEVKRQQLEQGALKGLSTGAVSRPKVAEAVVEADIARSGKQLTPEARKRAVTAELTNMKSMDNGDLSKYISYALIAGGVLAVLFDKSGKAAEGFNQGFNKQLDRNLAAGIQNQKARIEQAKMDQKMQIQEGNWKRDDTGLTIKQQLANQTGEYQDAQVEIGRGRLGNDTARVGIARQAEGRQASQGAAGLGLRAQALTLRQQELEYQHGQDEIENQLNTRKVAQGDTLNAIRAKKAAAGEPAPPGVALTEKQAGKVVKEFAESQGVKLDSGVPEALASQAQQASKNDPRWKTNPNAVLNELINGGSYEAEGAKSGIPFVPFTGSPAKIKRKLVQ